MSCHKKLWHGFSRLDVSSRLNGIGWIEKCERFFTFLQPSTWNASIMKEAFNFFNSVRFLTLLPNFELPSDSFCAQNFPFYSWINKKLTSLQRISDFFSSFFPLFSLLSNTQTTMLGSFFLSLLCNLLFSSCFFIKAKLENK